MSKSYLQAFGCKSETKVQELKRAEKPTQVETKVQKAIETKIVAVAPAIFADNTKVFSDLDVEFADFLAQESKESQDSKDSKVRILGDFAATLDKKSRQFLIASLQWFKAKTAILATYIVIFLLLDHPVKDQYYILALEALTKTQDFTLAGIKEEIRSLDEEFNWKEKTLEEMIKYIKSERAKASQARRQYGYYPKAKHKLVFLGWMFYRLGWDWTNSIEDKNFNSRLYKMMVDAGDRAIAPMFFADSKDLDDVFQVLEAAELYLSVFTYNRDTVAGQQFITMTEYLLANHEPLLPMNGKFYNYGCCDIECTEFNNPRAGDEKERKSLVKKSGETTWRYSACSTHFDRQQRVYSSLEKKIAEIQPRVLQLYQESQKVAMDLMMRGQAISSRVRNDRINFGVLSDARKRKLELDCKQYSTFGIWTKSLSRAIDLYFELAIKFPPHLATPKTATDFKLCTHSSHCSCYDGECGHDHREYPSYPEYLESLIEIGTTNFGFEQVYQHVTTRHKLDLPQIPDLILNLETSLKHLIWDLTKVYQDQFEAKNPYPIGKGLGDQNPELEKKRKMWLSELDVFVNSKSGQDAAIAHIQAYVVEMEKMRLWKCDWTWFDATNAHWEFYADKYLPFFSDSSKLTMMSASCLNEFRRKFMFMQ